MPTQLQVTLYGEPINNAVVRVPGRRNPGVIIQADTLSRFVDDAAALVAALRHSGVTSHDTLGAAEAIHEELADILDALKLELTKAGESSAI